MWQYIRSFHLALKDKNLHIILYTVIVLLAGFGIYDHFIYKVVDPYQEALLSKIPKYDLELSLQQTPETIEKGSIKVPVLIYHSVRPHTPDQNAMQKLYDVDPVIFEQQLKYLKDNGYVVIGLDYLADALEQNIILPQKSVVITFDDGWRNQYAYAFPLLKKYNDTATFFIVSSYVGGDYFLTWDQIKVMDNSGMTIGDHTKTHPYIPDVTDAATLKDEIAGSKKIIEQQIGRKIYTFAYPYGHYTEAATQVIKDAGFRIARTTYKGVNHVVADLYKLKGVEISDDMNAFKDTLK